MAKKTKLGASAPNNGGNPYTKLSGPKNSLEM
ncbi:Uncharacterised protein [Vibrio cholerae]|nr:Uncharacterised protein [Vibrio cholerae]